MGKVYCFRCGREIKRKGKTKGHLGRIYELFEQVGAPAVCCECEPSSNWVPKRR